MIRPRIHPKLVEPIAFRNIISGIPTNSLVDEISIRAIITQLGYKLIYEPSGSTGKYLAKGEGKEVQYQRRAAQRSQQWEGQEKKNCEN